MAVFWDETSLHAPAVTGEGGDQSILSWVGQYTTLYTGWGASLATTKSAVAVPHHETAVGRPSLASSPLGLFVAWAGTDGAATLNLALASQTVRGDPIVFQQKATLWGRNAPAGASISWAHDRLVMAWVDETGSERGLKLAWSSTPMDANSWNSTTFGESVVDVPSVSAFLAPDDIWLAWTDLDGVVNVASGFKPGSESFYQKVKLDGNEGAFFRNTQPAFVGGDTSIAGPQIEVDDLSFNLAYIGQNQHIYLISFFGGQFNRYKCSATSDVGPALSGRIAEGGYAWRGLNGAHSLNWAQNPFSEMGAVNDNAGG